jgi:hypothetical protein
MMILILDEQSSSNIFLVFFKEITSLKTLYIVFLMTEYFEYRSKTVLFSKLWYNKKVFNSKDRGREEKDMAKKLISVGLALTIMLFSSISIYADQNIQGDFFIRDIVVNGESIVNYNLQYPLISYNNTTYLPLSEDLGRIFGFESSMDWENRTLKLTKTEPTQKNLSKNTYKGDNLEIAVQQLTEIKVFAVEMPKEEATEEMASLSDPIVEELIIDDATPILAKGKYIYIPIKMLAKSEIFNWDLYYDTYFGICISTDKLTTPAVEYWDRQQSLYNMGIYAYIKEYNWGLPNAYAQKLVFMFKRAGVVYGIDEKLLIAIARKESTFNAAAQSRGGALGMMQIMPGTGERYGLSKLQLLDPKISINVGAMIVSERITAYGGDLVKGLSAYNQGSVTVNRGVYSKGYSTKVLSINSGVNEFLAINGYVVK